MTTLTTERINDLIEQREALTNRRDEHIDFAAVDAIDAQLATVPAGVNNTIDLRLGRPGAVLPERTGYDASMLEKSYATISAQLSYEKWSTDEQRAEWKDAGAAQIEQAAQAKMSEFEAHMQMLCADTDIESPDYPGMWK